MKILDRRTLLKGMLGAAAVSVASEIATAGGAATAQAMDVTKGQDVSATLRRIGQAHGRLDIIVSNAGINVRADFRHLTDADWVRIREVNLDGVVRLARDGFELLRASGNASLVNVSSVMARRWMPASRAHSSMIWLTTVSGTGVRLPAS